MVSQVRSAILGLTILATTNVYADKPMMAEMQMLAPYRQECGSCHMAYPPEFLSKPAWGRLMNSLSRHYGTDASLEPAAVREISAWLDSNGGTYKRVVPESKEDRLTTSAWFVRKHRKISSTIYQRASIKSPGNCIACHSAAVGGDFEDNLVKIPK